MQLDDILTEILRREGWPRYTDHPADRGGPTKGGITLATLAAWRRRMGQPVPTAADVEALTEAEVRRILRHLYVDEPGYGGIRDPHLQALVVDCAVLYGADDASPWLQRAATRLGAEIAVDGKVGPRTIAAVNALPARELALRIIEQRLVKMGRVITDDAKARLRTQDQALNAAGWSNRLAGLLAEITAA